MASPLLMRIHNKWYDVGNFDHPGGPIMLGLGEGRDATALFESHHPFTPRLKLEQMMKKFEVKGDYATLDPRDDGSIFVWPAHESKDADQLPVQAPVTKFAQECVQVARTYFEGEAKRRGVSFLEATKATPARWFELAIMTLLFTATLPFFVQGHWWTLFATPFFYWVWGVNVFHDASHFALSRNWKVNLLGTYVGWWFSSPFEWYHQHVIGHHAYPNLPNKDPDLYHNATMERHTKTLRFKPLHAIQHKTWVPIWWIGTSAMSFLKPAQMLLTGYYNRAVVLQPSTRRRILLHIFGRFVVLCLCYVWPWFVFPLWKAALFTFVPVGIVSLSFMACSQVNHLTPENIDVEDTDFYKHQVLTSHTFGVNSFFSFYFSGGLNFQIEHHLFPTINHCHLKALQPKIKEICARHKVFYHESKSFPSALLKYFNHMKLLSIKPKDE